MTFNELFVLLKSAGIPQKRIKSNKILRPPYIVIFEGEIEMKGADNKVLFKTYYPRIELYTALTDYSSYNTLSQILIDNNILFSSSDETQIEDEGIFVRYIDLEQQFEKI